MRKFHLLLTLVALSLATSSLWALPTNVDEGKLPGAFSVACGEYVYFSQGNLQYTKSTGIWSFMDEQYSILGSSLNSVNVGTNYANQDIVDLFGWGTSGYIDSEDSYCVHHMPYETSYNTQSNQTYNWYGYGPSLDKLPYGESWSKQVGEDHPYENYDWGVYNKISNGGNQKGLWRTLTIEEWNYLLGFHKMYGGSANQQARPNAANLNTAATVNGTKGVIIMPDGWTASTVTLTITRNDYTINVIEGDDWGVLEEQGCVFLPCTGDRSNTYTYPTNGWYYWSSTAAFGYNNNSRAQNACAVAYNSGNTSIEDLRSRGISVRLVRDMPDEEEQVLRASRPVASAATPPTPASNLTYNGTGRYLLTSAASGVTGGTVKYRLGTTGTWQTSYNHSSISATNAGTYTVQWFVEATGCYFDSEVEEIEVTIKRGTYNAPNPKPTIAAAAALTYTGSAQNLVTTTGSIQNNYTTVYSTDGVNWSTTIPQGTNAGDYTVYYKFYWGDNYEHVPSPNTIDVTIAKADLPGVTLPASTSSIPYDGAEHTLLEVDPVADCVIWYKLGDGDWTTTPPTGTDAGDYSVQYKIVPNDAENYNTIGPNTVTVTILDYPTVYDVNVDPTAKLTELLNTPSDLKIKRTIVANDEYNTLCLPFSLDASALAASPLAGFNRLKTLRGAKVTGIAPDLSIDILVEDATTIEAGIPYLISYPAGDNIVDPVFHGITVTATEPSAVTHDGVTFQGMFAQVHIDPYASERAEDYLFLGANSQLMWPASSQTDSSIKMRGFRAYFIIDRNSISPALAPKGTRARIVDAPKTATGIDDASAKFGESQKILENGILYIIRNGVRYNAQGQIVE